MVLSLQYLSHRSLMLVGKGLFSVSGRSMTKNAPANIVTAKTELVMISPACIDRVKALGARIVATAPKELTTPTALLRTIVGKT